MKRMRMWQWFLIGIVMGSFVGAGVSCVIEWLMRIDL